MPLALDPEATQLFWKGRLLNRGAEIYFGNEHFPTLQICSKKDNFIWAFRPKGAEAQHPKSPARESSGLDFVHGLTILVRVVEVAVVVQRDPFAKDILASAA